MLSQSPDIRIQFELNENGDPVFIEQDNLKHYKINVSMENVPADVYSVNYQLHPSYVNAFREECDKEKDFSFVVTTYGDYSLSASLLGKKRNYLTSGIVSKALKDAHSGNDNQNIKNAIKDISNH